MEELFVSCKKAPIRADKRFYLQGYYLVASATATATATVAPTMGLLPKRFVKSNQHLSCVIVSHCTTLFKYLLAILTNYQPA